MFAPRKAIWCVRRRKSFYPIGMPTSRRGAGGERKAPCWHDKRQLCRRNSPLAGPDAPTPARGQGLQPYGALYCFEWRSRRGAGGRAESPLLASIRDNFAEEIPLWRGLTRRLRRGSGTCRPMGRSHFSFDGERKVCKRKPAARHYGKKAFIAHFDGGARNVARNGVG